MTEIEPKVMPKQLATIIEISVLLIKAIRFQIQAAIDISNFNKPINIYKLFLRDNINQSIPAPPISNEIIKLEDFEICLYEHCLVLDRVNQPFLHSHLF